jgi:hypothetical protein
MTANLTSTNRPAIPRTVWALGFVSLFMDLSSELVHALLPVYLVTTMGLSVAALGVLEGRSGGDRRERQGVLLTAQRLPRAAQGAVIGRSVPHPVKRVAEPTDWGSVEVVASIMGPPLDSPSPGCRLSRIAD